MTKASNAQCSSLTTGRDMTTGENDDDVSRDPDGELRDAEIHNAC